MLKESKRWRETVYLRLRIRGTFLSAGSGLDLILLQFRVSHRLTFSSTQPKLSTLIHITATSTSPVCPSLKGEQGNCSEHLQSYIRPIMHLAELPESITLAGNQKQRETTPPVLSAQNELTFNRQRVHILRVCLHMWAHLSVQKCPFYAGFCLCVRDLSRSWTLADTRTHSRMETSERAVWLSEENDVIHALCYFTSALLKFMSTLRQQKCKENA